MKKIIAISVMFALIAGAVFADSSVGGGVETRFTLARGGGDGDPEMGGSADGWIVLSGSNSEGILGGQFRVKNSDIVRKEDDNSWASDGSGGGPWFNQVFVWWKPVQQVKVFLGIDQDGLFDTADFLGWGFHTGDNDYLFNHHWDFWRQVFPGNWDGFGLATSFYLMPGLDINLVLPTGKVNWPQATRPGVERYQPITNPDSDTKTGMIPGRLRLVANYSLDFGKISLVYLGGTVAAEKGTPDDIGAIGPNNNGLFGLSALITAVDGIQIKVGGSMALNDKDKDGLENLINGGLGVAWAGDGFGVKFRAAVVMQGDGDMFINGNVMPYFAAGEKGQVLVDIGVTSCGDLMGWYVTPAYRLGIDGGAFKIGLQIFNNIKMGGNIAFSGNDKDTFWAIPMSLSFNF